MKEYINIVDLDGCNYDIKYNADSDFKVIEIVNIECNGNDFTNILSECDKQRIINTLT